MKRTVMNNFVEVKEKQQLFQLFFLKDDEGQSVEVDEVKRIDFEMLTRRLKRGESVFIAPKRPQERNLNQSLFGTKKSWYFAHI